MTNILFLSFFLFFLTLPVFLLKKVKVTEYVEEGQENDYVCICVGRRSE